MNDTPDNDYLLDEFNEAGSSPTDPKGGQEKDQGNKEPKKKNKVTKKSLILIGGALIVGVVIATVLDSLSETPPATAPVAKSNPIVSKKNPKKTVIFDEKNSILNYLPDTTLCFWYCKNSSDLFNKLESNNVKRYLEETNIYSAIKKNVSTSVSETRTRLEAELPHRLKSLDPVTDFILKLAEHPLSESLNLSNNFPGETCLALVQYDDKDSLPVPHILFSADITKEINDTWLNNMCELLENYFAKLDVTSSFTHNSDTKTDDDKINFHYHKLGDKEVNLSIGIWKKKKLLISNNDRLFQKIIRAYHLGGKKSKKASPLDIHKLSSTKHYERLTARMDPLAADMYFYLQNNRLKELIRKTLPSDEKDMIFADRFGIDHSLDIACSFKFEGYSVKEKLLVLYDGSLPEESFLGAFNRLPVTKVGHDKLESLVPDNALMASRVQLDFSKLLNNTLELERKLYRFEKDKKMPISDQIGYLKGRFKLYLRDMMKKIGPGALVFINQDEGTFGVGSAFALNGQSKTVLKDNYNIMKELSERAIKNLKKQFPDQINTQEELFEDMIIQTINISPSLVNDEKTLHFFLNILMPHFNETDRRIWAKKRELKKLLKENIQDILNPCVMITPSHVLIGSTPQIIKNMFEKLKQPKATPYNNKSLFTSTDSHMSDKNSMGLFWFDTKKSLQQFGKFYHNNTKIFTNDYNTLKFEDKDLTTYFPDFSVNVQVLNPKKSRSNKRELPAGIFVESHSPLPWLSFNYLKWILEKRITKIFGPINVETTLTDDSQ